MPWAHSTAGVLSVSESLDADAFREVDGDVSLNGEIDILELAPVAFAPAH